MSFAVHTQGQMKLEKATLSFPVRWVIAPPQTPHSKTSPLGIKRMCETDWPFFGIGWPPEGTLDDPTIRNVHSIITGDSGHPDHSLILTSGYKASLDLVLCI